MLRRDISSFDDPLLAPYQSLKDKDVARDGGRFIAEGENVVRRLLASSTPVESVLLAHRKVAPIAPLCPDDVPVFVADDGLIRRIIGFEFHSGVIACGIRPPAPLLTEVIPVSPASAIVTVCQEITNAENAGSLIRIAAAFGSSAIVFGERCCDPWFRQSIRVSMGTIFSIPVVRSQNLLTDLDILRSLHITRLAAVISNDAEPLESVKSMSRAALVFGSEAQGLDPATIARCDRRVTIPMQRGTDSLNVAIAAGIFHYELTRPSPRN